MQPLPISNPTGRSSALGVSDDGNTIVGWHYFTTSFSAFRWTAATGMVNLGFRSSAAYDASADGSVVVGHDGSEAILWTTMGFSRLGLLGDDNQSEARAVSADGTVVVGRSYKTGSGFEGSEPFVWTPAGGMQGLGYRSDRLNSALDVSDDGRVIVGYVEGGGTTAQRAFLWTPEDGVRLLHDVLLEDYGVTLPGWTLASAVAVSADGATIVGSGSNQGGSEAWILTLPEPAGDALALASLCTLFVLTVAVRHGNHVGPTALREKGKQAPGAQGTAQPH